VGGVATRRNDASSLMSSLARSVSFDQEEKSFSGHQLLKVCTTEEFLPSLRDLSARDIFFKVFCLLFETFDSIPQNISLGPAVPSCFSNCGFYSSSFLSGASSATALFG
jgi:hypothetical protein